MGLSGSQSPETHAVYSPSGYLTPFYGKLQNPYPCKSPQMFGAWDSPSGVIKGFGGFRYIV